jgi:NitT/TauT family transport system ATP-binding protein
MHRSSGEPMSVIECQNVTKVWGADTADPLVALENVSFSVRSGEFVVIIGPSGCGKSTLLNLIAGLEMPTSGVLLHHGQPIAAPDPDRSLIFQQPSLLPWLSLIDNVALGLTFKGMGKQERYQRAEQFLAEVGLRTFAQKYPHQLSGGMQQRACIARALCLGADIILMDEPFAALDVQTRYNMQKFLLEIWAGTGKTVIFVTHHIDEAVFLADRVLILSAHPGRLLDSVEILMPRPRDVISPEFEQHRTQFVRSLRSEVNKAFADQELAEMLDTRIK